jgi:predicted ATPase
MKAESEGEARKTTAAVPSSALAVPASLHASLMARLDRLGPAKELAQIGATIGREFSYALLAAVARKPETELVSALDRLVAAGLVFPQGVPPYATYLFKHALVQDAAYGTLLRAPRRGLHARIAETLEREFVDISEAQPELLARHCTEAGLIEKAVGLWGKAGRRSLERSALVEAVEQFTRAVSQIATVPGTPALRREQIKLQVSLITPIVHVKGYSAPETKDAVEQARLLLAQADALGEAPEDPLQLFTVLYGFFVANVMAFNGDACRDIAAQTLELAEKQSASFPRVLGHNNLGGSLMFAGDIAEARVHLDQAISLYDPAAHRQLAMRFGEDQTVATLSLKARALWLLGYPEAALRDVGDALKQARETGQAATRLFALHFTAVPLILSGSYSQATALAQELRALADEKEVPFWKVNGSLNQGCLFALTDDASNKAIQTITSGITALLPTGVTLGMPWWLLHLAIAHNNLCQFDDARRYIGEAVSTTKTTKEKWSEAEVNRVAGEIAVKSSKPLSRNAEEYFEHALAIARKQQAKSWELRAAMSMARLWRDQGKPQQARELLAPVYGWFTEGFETRDLKEAKALLEELAA